VCILGGSRKLPVLILPVWCCHNRCCHDGMRYLVCWQHVKVCWDLCIMCC
jgi:hypothetical protein